MAKLYVPTIMRKHVDGMGTVELPGASVSEVFSQFVYRYPAVEQLLRDTTGKLHRHINVFVNSQDIRGLQGEATTVSDRDEVHVIPAMAGGAL
jgi:molybdopterin converting factor small subunit